MCSALTVTAFTRRGHARPPIVFALIASILSTGGPALAQEFHQGQADQHARAEIVTTPGSVGAAGVGVLRRAIAREAARLAQGSTPAQSTPRASGKKLARSPSYS